MSERAMVTLMNSELARGEKPFVLVIRNGRTGTMGLAPRPHEVTNKTRTERMTKGGGEQDLLYEHCRSW